MKLFLILARVLSFNAFAVISTFPGMKSIQCVDSKPENKAPVYFDVSANCLAFSSNAWRACSTSLFLRSTSMF